MRALIFCFALAVFLGCSGGKNDSPQSRLAAMYGENIENACVVFISEADCSSCADGVIQKIAGSSVPVYGLFYHSRKQYSTVFDELMMQTAASVNWKKTTDKTLLKVFSKLNDDPMKGFVMTLRNGEIIEIESL